MKKSKLGLIIAMAILIIVIIYFIFSPSTIENIITPKTEEPENETTDTSYPQQTPTSQSNKTGGGGAGEEGGEGSGGSSNYTKVNYTLSIDSFPSELNVLTNYSINGNILNITKETPYSIGIESDTVACVLLTQVSVSGTIRWELDGEDCEPSFCLDFIGCNILMDEPHTAVVYYTPAT